MSRRLFLGLGSAVGIGAGAFYVSQQPAKEQGWDFSHQLLSKWNNDKVTCMGQPRGLITFRWNQPLTEGHWEWTVSTNGKVEVGISDNTFAREVFVKRATLAKSSYWRSVDPPRTYVCGNSMSRTPIELGNEITFAVNFNEKTLVITDTATGKVVATSKLPNNTIPLYPVARFKNCDDSVQMTTRPFLVDAVSS
eukprot:TRINITY_DN808_c3_g1_i1.p1 TRINITY_DN808_c3_g1~~TRINITY_DN808_c3_g1_i1.p1  ORF type:complete len:222 (+),score=26.64 TRINITY_DN808_c3_g1_i1:87-668(+)